MPFVLHRLTDTLPEAHTRAIVGGAVTAATAKGMTGMMPNLSGQKSRRNLLHLAILNWKKLGNE